MSASARRCAGDAGGTVVLFASMLGPLLILVAIVVDLGLARVTKDNLKAATDLAAVAAGFFLAGDGSESPVSNPQLACNAALGSLKQNLKDLPANVTLAPACSANFPSNARNCSDSGPKRTSTAVAGAYTIAIDYPVPASDLVDERLQNGVGDHDGQSPCARLRVSVRRNNAAVFGGIVKNGGMSVSASSVVRAGLSPNGVAAPAILLLDRSNCGTLNASGQGGVRVKGALTAGGWIHTDSAGGGVGSIGSNCQGGTSCTASNYTIVGTGLPSSAGGGPSIVAESSSGSSGRIGSFALYPRIGGAGGCAYPGGMNVPVTSDPIVSRTPIDLRFNSVYNAPGAALDTLHSTGYSSVTGSAPAGYAVIEGKACSQDNTVWKADKVFLACPSPGGFSGKNVVFRASNVILTGPLNVAGGYVAFPNSRSILVRGCTSCAEAVNVSSNGFLAVNTGESVPGKWSMVGALNAAGDGAAGGAPGSWPATDCLTDRATAPQPTTLASFSGSLYIHNATANLCQTFVYVGDNTSSHVLVAATSAGNCSLALPCPSSTPPTKPIFDLNSGSNPAVSWTAPNQNLSGPSVASPFDGLALWTEGGTTCSIGGQGALSTSGVFFFPNCNVTYSGQANTNIPLAAQFIGRSLTMSGQGVLTLQPDPKHSVAVAAPGTVELIR